MMKNHKKNYIPHDRKRLLSIKNPEYREAVRRFFEWQFLEDGEDITSRVLFENKKNSTGVEPINPITFNSPHSFSALPVSSSSPNLVSGFSSDEQKKAKIIARENGIMAGREEAEWFFNDNNLQIKFFKKDGEEFSVNECIAELKGGLRALLKAERILLNFLSRMSGIAQKTAQNVQKFPNLASTRKTLWGRLDKKAVAVGGGLTHRINASDFPLIKENHLRNFETEEALDKFSGQKIVEIEVENEAEFLRAFAWAKKSLFTTIIMLDNFSPERLKKTLKNIQKPENVFFEASGGVSEENLADYKNTGAQVVSAGFLTKNAVSADFSMLIE